MGLKGMKHKAPSQPGAELRERADLRLQEAFRKLWIEINFSKVETGWFENSAKVEEAINSLSKNPPRIQVTKCVREVDP